MTIKYIFTLLHKIFLKMSHSYPPIKGVSKLKKSIDIFQPPCVHIVTGSVLLLDLQIQPKKGRWCCYVYYTQDVRFFLI